MLLADTVCTFCNPNETTSNQIYSLIMKMYVTGEHGNFGLQKASDKNMDQHCC